MVQLLEKIGNKSEHPPLSLETLKKGLEHVNTGYTLPEVLNFIYKLNSTVKVYTKQPRNALTISTTPLSFLEKATPQKDTNQYSLAIITHFKPGDSKLMAEGKRKEFTLEEFNVLIPLIEANGKTSVDPQKHIEINTEFSMGEMRKIITETLGNIPKNWELNPEWIPPETVKCKANTTVFPFLNLPKNTIPEIVKLELKGPLQHQIIKGSIHLVDKENVLLISFKFDSSVEDLSLAIFCEDEDGNLIKEYRGINQEEKNIFSNFKDLNSNQIAPLQLPRNRNILNKMAIIVTTGDQPAFAA